MRWDELTSDQFPAAVERVQGVCLLPTSCIERHARHLPLGTDYFIGRELCRRAAGLEPAIIFPEFIFTQILEARHCAGTVAIDLDLSLRLLDNVCREIARNGLRKIVLVNSHGGNYHLLHFFAQSQLAQPRDYVVYLWEQVLSPEDEAGLQAQWESKVDGHAGESETGEMLAVRPELVDRAALRADGEGNPLGRLQALREAGLYTGAWWYADHPTHYRGDGTVATAEKGLREFDSYARALARAIRVVKEDGETMRLQQEFYDASKAPGRRSP